MFVYPHPICTYSHVNILYEGDDDECGKVLCTLSLNNQQEVEYLGFSLSLVLIVLSKSYEQMYFDALTWSMNAYMH